jgi:hypothetical protein
MLSKRSGPGALAGAAEAGVGQYDDRSDTILLRPGTPPDHVR